MPILSNARHERFAQALATGKPASEAYVIAGYEANDGNASRLNGNEKVVSRVAEILAGAAKRAEITAADVLAELAKMGFSNMLDYTTVDSSGRLTTDFSKLTRDQAAAIQEITTETRFERDGDDSIPVVKTKFKLADKRGSLELLGKNFGLFKERVEHSGPDGKAIEFISETEAARRIAALLTGASK